MPEFLVSDKYKEIFNEYDLSVIKAAHLAVPQDKIAADRSAVSRAPQRPISAPKPASTF